MKVVQPEQAALLSLKNARFNGCGGQHHFDPKFGGIACPLEVRERNTGCAHAVHFGIQWAITLLKIRGFIEIGHAANLEKIFDECQDELTTFDRVLGTLEKCRNEEMTPEEEEQAIDKLFGPYSYGLPVDRRLDNIIPWAKERQRVLAIPIEKTRRMLVALLSHTLKPNASKEWTQERADRFLSHLAETRSLNPSAELQI